ncbi:MAG: PEP-CTERM sorting domain-containing protein [Opitutaceae bacterium]|jgi:hypothetical protein
MYPLSAPILPKITLCAVMMPEVLTRPKLNRFSPPYPMKNKIRYLKLAALSALFTPAGLFATLTISDADIQNGTYYYDLTFADLSTSQFFSDVDSFSNVSVSSEANWKYVYTTASSADFVYKFDFSGTSSRPDSVTLTGGGRVFGDSTGNYFGTVSVFYRIGDAGGWTLINSVNNSFTGSTTNRGYSAATSIALTGMPDTFYYKVVYQVDTGAASNRYQWDRINGTTDNNFFSATFSTVAIPEPAAFAMLVGGFGLLATVGVRRRIRA